MRYPQIHDRDWLYDQLVVKKKSFQAIAKDVGCNPNTVWYAANKLGLKSTYETGGVPMRYPQIHDRDWLYDQLVVKKKSFQAIAKDVGCNPNTVWYAANKLGLKSTYLPVDKIHPLPPQLHDAEWVFDQLVTQGKTKRQIAREIGCHECTVHRSARYLSKFGPNKACYLAKARALLNGKIVDPHCEVGG